jgi:hypothetical protein
VHFTQQDPSIVKTGYLLGTALLLQGICLTAHAALGADVASVEADRVHMKAEVRVSSAPVGYTVHEIRTPMQTVVREYVSASGRVFAVSWSGPMLPDLQQTLGSYYQDYQAAARAPHSGHRHLQVSRAELVIHSAGHMRAFAGYAYLPAMLPANLSPDDIK